MARIEYLRQFSPSENKDLTFGTYGDDIKFRRIAGGLQWPNPLANKPGYALILTEDVQIDESAQIHHLRVIEGQEDQRIDQLLFWCESKEINTPMECKFGWFADNTNRPNMEFVWAIRRNSRESGRLGTLNIIPPPYIEFRIEERNSFYIQNIRNYMEKEALHYPYDSKLVADLESTDEDKMPYSVMALAYVVSAMATWPNTGKIME